MIRSYNYNTRNSNLYYASLPFVEQKSDNLKLIIKAQSFFNTLNQNIRDASTASCFHYRVKNYLLLSM